MLPGGTIERYLPSFSGDLFNPSSEAKRNAVKTELVKLRAIRQSDDLDRDATLAARYGALYEVVRRLPSKAPVDFDGVLRGYLSDYVHELQKVVAKHTDWERVRIDKHMQQHSLQKSGVVWLDSFQRSASGRFDAIIGVSEIVGGGRRCLDVDSDTTIANMNEFRCMGQESITSM